MNGPLPLTPEQVDLLLSAELDDEFDAAASDLDLTPADARSLLAAAPGVDTRRAALTAARDQLAEPIEIDELLGARLRTKALKAAAVEHDDVVRHRRTRRTRVYGMVAGIAAALVAVVAIGAGVQSNDAKDSTNVSAAAPERTTQSFAAGDANGARNQAPTPLSHQSNNAAVDDMANDVRDRFGARPASAGFTTLTQAASALNKESADATSAYKCESVARALDGSDERALSQAQTAVGGQPLSVYVYARGDEKAVYVFDRECRLVNQQLVH
jgi:hypothetical protein